MYLTTTPPLEYYTPMKRKWPTLEGRISHPLTSRAEAIKQMRENGDILTPMAEKYERTQKRRSKRIRARAK